jgi:hypothetical protein
MAASGSDCADSFAAARAAAFSVGAGLCSSVVLAAALAGTSVGDAAAEVFGAAELPAAGWGVAVAVGFAGGGFWAAAISEREKAATRINVKQKMRCTERIMGKQSCEQ